MSPLRMLERDLDEARAESARTGDAGLRWRIGELVGLIKTTPPESLERLHRAATRNARLYLGGTSHAGS